MDGGREGKGIHTLEVLEGGVGDDIDGRTNNGMRVNEDVDNEGLQPSHGHLAVGIEECQGAAPRLLCSRKTCPNETRALAQAQQSHLRSQRGHISLQASTQVVCNSRSANLVENHYFRVENVSEVAPICLGNRLFIHLKQTLKVLAENKHCAGLRAFPFASTSATTSRSKDLVKVCRFLCTNTIIGYALVNVTRVDESDVVIAMTLPLLLYSTHFPFTDSRF